MTIADLAYTILASFNSLAYHLYKIDYNNVSYCSSIDADFALENEVENALKVFHYEVLDGKGKISHKQAIDKAESEYEKYKVIQDKNYVSDFDKLLKETKVIENK